MLVPILCTIMTFFLLVIIYNHINSKNTIYFICKEKENNKISVIDFTKDLNTVQELILNFYNKNVIISDLDFVPIHKNLSKTSKGLLVKKYNVSSFSKSDGDIDEDIFVFKSKINSNY